MYNWSTDEEKFKNVTDVVRFLKNQPEVIYVKPPQKNKNGALIKVQLSPNIHPAIKTTLAKILQERCDQLAVSVIEG